MCFDFGGGLRCFEGERVRDLRPLSEALPPRPLPLGLSPFSRDLSLRGDLERLRGDLERFLPGGGFCRRGIK